MIRLGPPNARCHVLTIREGMLSRLGHDLELAVTRFDIRVNETARSVDASFDAASLRVVRALRDGVELPPSAVSESDRRTIEDNVRRTVLETGRYPEIRFRSSRVVDVEGGVDVTGRLVLHGKERELTVRLVRSGDRYEGDVTLHQPDFGITPYSAMLGALRVKPDVVVRLSLPAEPSQSRPAAG
jgi:polyisoprenoid-binding protein YceI